MKRFLKMVPFARALVPRARGLALQARRAILRARARRRHVIEGVVDIIRNPRSIAGGSGSALVRVRRVVRRIPLVRVLARRVRRLGRRGRAGVTRLLLPFSRSSGAHGRAGGGGAAADDYSLTRVEWRDQGATPGIVARARSLTRNSVAWQTMHPRIWLVFCAALLEAGDFEGAERILRIWIGRTPNAFETLALCLPVARFARDIGVRARPVERAADAADVLAANRDANVFGRLVEGKSIAVVGNGPGSLRSGRGEEIDAHDLVIRFNNFPRGFEVDYGARTDIWVRGAHRDVADRFEIEDFAQVVWEMDFFRNLLEVPDHGEILYRDTRFSPEKITHIDTATKLGLWQRSGLLLPTSGAQILWMLQQNRGSLRGVDVYGFSTIDGSAEHGHYFDALGDMGTRHDVGAEGAFLRSLLAEGREAELRDDDEAAATSWDETALAGTTASAGAFGDVVPRAPKGDVTVFSCAYREYDPASGKTGGPGGVLATQRLALGDEYRGQELAYVFQGANKSELRSLLAVETAGLSGKIADILIGGEYIRTHPDILRAINGGRPLLLVCHELGSAYGAHLLGVPYVLVYHQQGSTLQEMRSIGGKPTSHETAVVSRLERTILENAQKVYFPSLGARDSYRATTDARPDGHVSYADRALYNTVSAVDHSAKEVEVKPQLDALLRELKLPAKDGNTDVFISVGDFNADKGLDRVPALLQRHASVSGRQVVWIAIGAASDEVRFLDLQRARRRWNFTARLIGERTTHSRLLALLDYADYYVMMHRTAIFDLATLEAMRAGKALVLSPVGGNLEVDLDGNVLFVTEDTIDDAARVLETRDPVEWGQRNRRVFEENFSLAHFAARYRTMLDEQLDVLLASDEVASAESEFERSRR